MSNSFVITEVLHGGILVLSSIITPNLSDSAFSPIVNNLDVIDDDLTCFILRM